MSGNVNTTESRQQQRQQDTATTRTSSSVVQTLFVPVRTFRIPETQMALSGEALLHARTIQDRRQAIDFLHDFYSHVPSTVITLGGIFSRSVTVTVTQITSVQALASKARASLNSNIGAGGGGFGFSGNVAVSTSSFQDLDEQGRTTSDQRNCIVQSSVTAYGPPVYSADVFVAQLLSNRDTWRIIDRGDHRTLIPVWTLLLRHPEAAVCLSACCHRLLLFYFVHARCRTMFVFFLSLHFWIPVSPFPSLSSRLFLFLFRPLYLSQVQAAGRLVRQAWLYMAHELQDIPIVREAFERTLADAQLEDMFVRPNIQNVAVQLLPEPPHSDRDAELGPLQQFANRSAQIVLRSPVGDSNWERLAAQAIVRAFMAIRQWSAAMNNPNLICQFLMVNQPLANALIACAQRCVSRNEAPPHPFPAVRDALFACISGPHQADLQAFHMTAPLFNNPEILRLFRTRAHVNAASSSADGQWYALTVQHGAALISELRRLLDTEEAEATVLSKVQRTLVWNLFQAKFASNREAVRLKHMLQEEFGLYYY